MMQKVGRFQILHRILTGETDAVYLVADPEAERKLALKMVQLDWFAGADRATQLRQDLWNDVYKARRLRHPAIIVPEDVFEQLGVCWFVMDFVQGQDLGQLFAQKTQLEKPIARSIARQIAEALDHVHQAGLTHGRLRPSKLMLTSDGSVRILGLGLSRVSFSGREGNGHGSKASHYLSPEQIAGESACAQSDQFAMAAIVYQLLTGSKAFPGEGDEVRLDISERDPLPAADLNPTLDSAVSRVLARALAKSPKARFPTCVEFASALEEALEASPDWVVPVPSDRPRVLPAVQDLVQNGSLASIQSVAPNEAFAQSDALAQSEALAKSEAVAQSEAVGQREESSQVPAAPLAPAPEWEPHPYDSEPSAAAWLRWPKLAVPVMAVALLAIVGIYFAYRQAPAGDPRISSQAVQSLQITSAELPVGKVGNSYSAHLNAAGESAPYRWTLAEGSLPPGLTLDEDSGEIRGTPAATGVFPVSVSVSSASNQTASAPLTVKIDSDLAIVTPPDLPGGAIGQRYTARLAAAEVREPAVWSVADGTLPAGLSLDAASGTLQGVPAKAGVFPFTLRVRDATEAVAEQAFTLRLGSGLTITTPGVLPQGTLTQRYSAKLSAAAGSLPLRWSVKSGSLAPGLSLNAADGTLAGSPSRPGRYQFTVEATDASQATASQAFTLEVGTGLRIMSQSALPAAAIGSRYSHALLSERGEQPLRWTLLGGSLPPGLSLSPSSGTIEGSPSAAGRFSFDARVTDASNTTASQRFSLDVAVPLVMVTSSGLQNGVIDKEYLQNLEARGGAPPYEWSLTGGSLPQGLSLDQSRSAIRGVPAMAGAFPFRLRVRDAAGATLESTLNLEIGSQLSIATSPDLPAANLAEEYSLVLASLGGRPPYTWSLVDGNLPPEVSLDASSGRVRGRPARTGDFLFSARVTDGAGAQAQRTFRLSVASSLRLSSAPMLPEAMQGQPYSHTLTAAGGRPPYQWTVQGELPAGLALDSSTGVIQGTPSGEGRFSFQIQLRGAAGETASRSTGLLVQSAASGEIVWRGNLEANRVLTIQDGRYPSSGAMTGSLPGVPIQIEIEPQGLTVVTPPGPGNDWKLLVIHGGDQPRTELIIRWKRAP